MQVCLKIILVLTFSDFVYFVFAYRERVVFVDIIARHGVHNPTWFYANDPNQNKTIFIQNEKGLLLEKGKKQSHRLGKWLRRRYGHLFSNPNHTYVVTTDVERVKQSARCCLAAIFSFHKAKMFMPVVKHKSVDCNTTIHLHSLKETDDHLLGGRAKCQAYTEEYERVYNSKEIVKKNKKFKKMYEIINKESGNTASTGNPGDRFEFIQKIFDVILVEEDLRLKPQPWARKIMPKMKKAAILGFIIFTWNENLKRLRSGPLVAKVVEDMQDKIYKRNELNAKFYYTNDNTIVSLLNTLGVYDKKELPDFASFVILELVKVCHGDYFVKLYYSQSTKPHPKLLIHQTFQSFIKTTQHFIPCDWHEECKVATNQ